MQPARALVPTRGFALMAVVFMVVVLSLAGLALMAWLRPPAHHAAHLARRAALTDAADLALLHMRRELQTALPHSVRIDASGRFLEFLPLRASGRYRAAPGVQGEGASFDAQSPHATLFDVLGPPVDVQPGDQLVVHNLGMPGADAYEGTNRRRLLSTGPALQTLHYANTGLPFPVASPSHHFHIVQHPVTYACSPIAGGAGELRRYSGYAIAAGQPVSTRTPPLVELSDAHNAVLAPGVSDCHFTLRASATGPHDIVTLQLTLSDGVETVRQWQPVRLGAAP